MSQLNLWQPLTLDDLSSVNALADAVHETLPERPEVFAEKLSLFPEGCRKLLHSNSLAGYAVSHPWLLGHIPPLDAFLGSLPRKADCLYIHDVVVAPIARGAGAASAFLDYVSIVAREHGLGALALVSVYGTDVLWGRYGFGVVSYPSLTPKLTSYGPTAKYMTRMLG